MQLDLEQILEIHQYKIGQKLQIFSFEQIFSPQKEKINTLALNVLSMANALGGYILIGLKKQGRTTWIKEETKLEVLHPEDLKARIAYFVQPVIPQLVIWKEGEQIVIEVPQSGERPHAFSDYKYYKRQQTKNTVLEEYEIREMYQRDNQENISVVGISNTQGIPYMKQGLFEKLQFYPKIHIQNLGRKVARIYKLELKVPSVAVEDNYTALQAYFKGFEKNKSLYHIVGTDPLFQQEILLMAEISLVINANNYHEMERENIEINLFSENKVHRIQFNIKEWLLYKGQWQTLSTFVR